jgi:hypothetical protein
MSSNRFANELKEGYLGIAHCLSPHELDLISRARDPINTGGVERNRLLTRIVCCYRTGPKAIWGPVVLDLLAPTLTLMLRGLRPVPPAIDETEIRQQLVAETLRCVATVPVLESGLGTRFRITSRIYTNMLRWLTREGRRRRSQVSFDHLRERRK